MQEPVSDGSADLDQLRAELLRLKIKRSETEDLDIRKALEERITMLATQIATLKAAAPPEEIEIPIEPATPEQIAQADQLIREARVQKMRKNLQASTDLLKKASEIAPGAPAVLEALGDDLMERRRLNEAANAYKQAVRFDPTNVGLERKHAMAVMGIVWPILGYTIAFGEGGNSFIGGLGNAFRHFTGHCGHRGASPAPSTVPSQRR